MAHMYPEGGPTKPTTRDAERRIYNQLQRALDDNYIVFHSSPWSVKEDDLKVRDGEVDFIVAHPEFGIVLFEVKGGRIEYNGTRDVWTSKDRHGEVHKIKDAFMQVRSSKYALRDHLAHVSATKRYISHYLLNTAVWFPDITWTPGAIPLPYIIDDRVLDSTAMKNPGQAIFELFSRLKRRPIPPEALAALIDVLAPHRVIKARLRDFMNGEDTEFIRLRDDQYRKLASLNHFPRVTVRGAAGTGKTVIGLERARRLAEQGLDVLFLCSNPSLARWLQSMVGEENEAEIRSHLQVRSIDDLIRQLGDQAGISAIEDAEMIGTRDRQVRLASRFSQAIARLENSGTLPLYDAIFVDEAQDIERPLWTPLYKVLRDRRQGKFVALYDPAQSDIPGADDTWMPAIPNGQPLALVLTENCRNTQSVFRVAQQFYTADLEPPVCIGPAGQDVEWICPADISSDPALNEAAELNVLESVLDTLIEQDGIAPRDILIVACRSQENSAIYKLRAVGKHALSTNPGTKDPTHVRVMTIRTVKGLESPVVILAELRGMKSMRSKQPQQYSRYMYVAMSRAINHMIVLGPRVDTQPLQPSLATSLL